MEKSIEPRVTKPILNSVNKSTATSENLSYHAPNHNISNTQLKQGQVSNLNTVQRVVYHDDQKTIYKDFNSIAQAVFGNTDQASVNKIKSYHKDKNNHYTISEMKKLTSGGTPTAFRTGTPAPKADDSRRPAESSVVRNAKLEEHVASSIGTGMGMRKYDDLPETERTSVLKRHNLYDEKKGAIEQQLKPDFVSADGSSVGDTFAINPSADIANNIISHYKGKVSKYGASSSHVQVFAGVSEEAASQVKIEEIQQRLLEEAKRHVPPLAPHPFHLVMPDKSIVSVWPTPEYLEYYKKAQESINKKDEKPTKDEKATVKDEEKHSAPEAGKGLKSSDMPSFEVPDWDPSKPQILPDFIVGKGVGDGQYILINGKEYIVRLVEKKAFEPTNENLMGDKYIAIPRLKGG